MLGATSKTIAAAPEPARRAAFLWLQPFAIWLVSRAVVALGLAFGKVYIPYGQWSSPVAYRDNLKGLIAVPDSIVWWNVEKM